MYHQFPNWVRRLLSSPSRARYRSRARAISTVARGEILETRQMLSAIAGTIIQTLPIPGSGVAATQIVTHHTPSGNGGSSSSNSNHSKQNPGPQDHLIIIPTFDSTITSDANSAAIEKAINSVIAAYDAAFSDPITVNITFKTMTSGLGMSETFYGQVPYSQFQAALTSGASTVNDAVSLAKLPTNATTDPVQGQSLIDVKTANQKALGIISSGAGEDGTISLNTSLCNLDRVNINSNKYDLQAVAAHEIDEVLGFGSNIGGADGLIFPQDLFRFDQNGARSFTTSATAQAYFSLDGTTDLTQFNQDSAGDYGDWFTGPVPHVQDAFGTPGITMDPNVEFVGLDVQGYHLINTSNAPIVISNPVSTLTVNAGDQVTLSATASFNPTVQWQVSTDGGKTFSNISGATSTPYRFTAATTDDKSQFRAVFTNSQGSATTTVETLTVTNIPVAPVVTTDPTSQTINAGQQVSFIAAARGNPAPIVQWQVSTDGGNTFVNISGATSTTYSFSVATTDSGKEYQAVFSNSQGTATTKSATLTVLSAPVITINPLSQLVAAEQIVTFSAAATGNPVPTVQWQVSTDGGTTFTNISGATSSTFSFTAASTDNTNQYQAVFTNSQGSATTTPATLTVSGKLAAPVVTTDPTSQTIAVGQVVTFSAGASGTPTPTIQWEVSTDGGSTFTKIPGETSATLTFTVAIANHLNQYLACFTNFEGIAFTKAATLTVANVSAPVVTTNPVSQLISVGKSVTFTAAAKGAPTPSVQWQMSTNGGKSFTNILGATSNTYRFTVASSQNGYEYQAVFTNALGKAKSLPATLTVTSKTAPVVTTNPSSQSVPVGQKVTFTATATGSPIPTTQWQVSSDRGKTFVNISGATGNTYAFTVTSAQNGFQYQAVFTNAIGKATTSTATLTVSTAPKVANNPLSQTVTNGQRVSFTAAATGSPTPTVQWQVSTDGGRSFANVPGATSTTYTFLATSADDGHRYQAVFSNSLGKVTTTAATLSVFTLTAPVVTSNPTNQSANSGQSVSFVAIASGTPTPSVQWQVSTDGGKTFANISGATLTTFRFTTVSSQNGNQYRAVFTNSQGKATSKPATLTVLTAPIVTIQPTSQTITAGQTVTFTAAATGTPVPTVQWQVSTDGGKTFKNISGATSSTLSFLATAAVNGYKYQAVFTNSLGKATTLAAVLTVKPA